MDEVERRFERLQQDRDPHKTKARLYEQQLQDRLSMLKKKAKP